jgi:hypothetical protein
MAGVSDTGKPWTRIGVAIAAVPVVVLLVAPWLISGPALSFTNIVGVSVGLLLVGLVLRQSASPVAHVVGGVFTGIGATWLAFVAAVIALLLASAGNWGY